MKLAVITDYFPNSATPWQGRSAYQTLVRLGETVDLKVFCCLAKYPSFLSPKTALVGYDPEWRPEGVDVMYLSYPALPQLSRPVNGFSIASRLMPHVEAYGPDIVLNYMVYPQGLAAVRLARKLEKPVILTAIGSDLNRISDVLCGALTKYTLRNADVVTTVSSDLAQTARRLGAIRTEVILNGCDTTVFYPRDRARARMELDLDSEGKVVLYVGRMDLRKGLMELIESIASLRGRSGLKCFLVGEGPDARVLRDAVSRHALTDDVSFIPACTTQDVAVWMSAADVVVLPSYMEGCPNVVLEALSCGRPVVATEVGGIPELMNEGSGILVTPRDVPALSAALGRVLDQDWDPKLISSEHSRSWQDVANDLLAVIHSVHR